MTDNVVVPPANANGFVFSESKDHGYRHNDGLTAKDTLFIKQGNDDIAYRNLKDRVEENGRISQLNVEKNHGDARLFNSESFGSLRELIRVENFQTRQMIADAESKRTADRFADQLTAAKDELTLLKLKAALIPAPSPV